MTDTQPRRDVGPPGNDSDEKSTLLAFLNYVRDAVAAKTQGLDDEQGRTSGVPSGTSVFGLVKHLTSAELYWFVWAFEGADVAHPDFGMELAEGDSAESLLAAYRGAIERSNEIIEGCDDLNRPCARAAGKAEAMRSMRWVLVHMIEETARHAGHADILREQADGSVGR
ncbi:DinB family protein [Streptomyces sp. NBC_01142]|uniref:DinB family protein n=1 Tax=Streptomyces sp. NBC_01142 TaxID=2975865 RepID=UPI00225747E4|nr:DinB family protein [Streptomyces sp. NBC_01142]MCX4821443.1 DinB family protein [Streptomyces sp. NBC_01142]